MNVTRPQSIDEALTALAEAREPVRLIAGGTDLLVSWHHLAKTDWHLLDLTPLAADLHYVRLADDALELGALATYWDVLSRPEIVAQFPLLADAARQVGALQIQTRGTWAGNVGNASPAADGVPVLMAYDASVVLQSRGGSREIPLAEFYTGYRESVRRPDELITAIRVPRRAREHAWFHKVGARTAQAITKVGVAVAADALGWRVVANSVAPVVCRCPALETALADGRTFASPAEVRQLLEQDVKPIDDIRSTAAYRINVLSRLLYFWLRERGL